MGYEVLVGRIDVCIRRIGDDHPPALEMEDRNHVSALVGVPGLVTEVGRS